MMSRPLRNHGCTRCRAAAIVVSMLAASCSSLEDEQAGSKAPTIEGIGTSTLVVTAKDPESQRLAQQGLQLAYAFEHDEAARSFKAASARDASCAICAWGVAYSLGPNINQPERGNEREIRRYLARAQAASAAVSPKERALIEALSVRYGVADVPKQNASEAGAASMCTTRRAEREVHPQELAYAVAMTEVLAQFPDDPDVVTLYADAVMTTSPWDWWDAKTGAPNGSMAEVVRHLSAARAKHPQHTGAAHFLIHASEQSATPEVATPGADVLGTLAPNAPHLVHMPSHTYVHVGRFADAAMANQSAIKVQKSFDEQIRAQGYSKTETWDRHHLHFLWYASLSAGQGDLSLATARTMVSRFGHSANDGREYVRSLTVLSLVRLQRWDEILALPRPTEGLGLTEGMWHYARGVAYARTGRVAQARAEAESLQQMAALSTLQRARMYDQPIPAEILNVAGEVLNGVIASVEGRHETAIASLTRAVGQDDELGGEPPLLAVGPRLLLAQVLLAAGRPLDSETEMLRYLKRNPGNPWALALLQQSLVAQGKIEEAGRTAEQLTRALASADPDVQGLLLASSPEKRSAQRSVNRSAHQALRGLRPAV